MTGINMKVVRKTLLAGAVLLASTGSAMSAQSGKLSWFDDAPFAGVGALGVPQVQLRNPSEYNSFGFDLYRSQRTVGEDSYPAETGDVGVGASSVSFYGEIETPGNQRPSSFEETSGNRVNAFGVRWQHHVDTMNSFAISAEYGEGAAVNPSPLDTLDTRAAISWTSRLPSAVKPSVTGSVFLGDEVAREEIYRHLGRRYYGFTVGGSLTLFQSHTPYVSFKMQKSLYDTADEPSFVSPRSGDRSLLSAGWKWQVQRGFSLQAEASYGLGSSTTSLDPYSLERSRILFGTRFGFK
jgi:hypothetical protein